MIRIKRILLPTDFSQLADLARPHGFELARRFGAELMTLHVPATTSEAGQSQSDRFDEASEDGRLVRRMHRMLVADALTTPTIRYRVVRGASPVEGILKFMEEARIDLTVMGAHGESGNGCYPLGRVTQRVIRSTTCPVLTVGKTVRQNNPLYQRILVVLADSGALTHAISLSAGLASRFEADVHAVWVGQGAESQASRKAVLPLFRERLGKTNGNRLGLRFHDLGVNLHQEIVDIARENWVNLIILGKNALPVKEQERVIRDVDCPVIPCCSPNCRVQAPTRGTAGCNPSLVALRSGVD